MVREIIVKVQYIWWALKRINKPHIGDLVKYDNKLCFLNQGAAHPCWNLMPLTKENLLKEKRDIFENVHISDFKLIRSLSIYWLNLESDYYFQIRNWYKIDTSNDHKLFDKIAYTG